VSGAGGCLHTALYARSRSGKRGRRRIGRDRGATTGVGHQHPVRATPRDQTPGSLPSGSRIRRSRSSMRRSRSISASALRSRSCSSTRAVRQRWSVSRQSSSMRRESSCVSRDRRLSRSIASPAPRALRRRASPPEYPAQIAACQRPRAAVCNQTHARPPSLRRRDRCLRDLATRETPGLDEPRASRAGVSCVRAETPASVETSSQRVPAPRVGR
jgi:hypothetical protein